VSGLEPEPSQWLRNAVERRRQCEEKLEEAIAELHEAIASESGRGVMQKKICEETGLSRDRIRMIVKQQHLKRLK
jgi:hypothetical protein